MGLYCEKHVYDRTIDELRARYGYLMRRQKVLFDQGKELGPGLQKEFARLARVKAEKEILLHADDMSATLPEHERTLDKRTKL